MKRATLLIRSLAVLVLAFGFIACDTLEDVNPFNNEKEVQGIVEAIGDASLTVDGIEYTVTADTEFDGIDGLADLAVGNEVEVEYEESGGARTAVEVELADGDGD